MLRTPVVDALDLEHIERAPDVGRRPLLAGVRDDVQAELAAAREHARELLRRVAESRCCPGRRQ